MVCWHNFFCFFGPEQVASVCGPETSTTSTRPPSSPSSPSKWLVVHGTSTKNTSYDCLQGWTRTGQRSCTPSERSKLTFALLLGQKSKLDIKKLGESSWSYFRRFYIIYYNIIYFVYCIVLKRTGSLSFQRSYLKKILFLAPGSICTRGDHRYPENDFILLILFYFFFFGPNLKGYWVLYVAARGSFRWNFNFLGLQMS